MKRSSLNLIVIAATLISSSLMCSLFGPSGNSKISDGEKKATLDSLQNTVSALEKAAVTPTTAPTTQLAFPTMVKQPAGSIGGKLSYPSESIPPLRIVAIKVDTGEYFSTEVFDQGTYQLDGLPVGKYHVIAYLVDHAGLDPNLAGGYTQYVSCGQTASCSDHSLLDVEVKSGLVTSYIDPADWYAPPGSFPADPTK